MAIKYILAIAFIHVLMSKIQIYKALVYIIFFVTIILQKFQKNMVKYQTHRQSLKKLILLASLLVMIYMFYIQMLSPPFNIVFKKQIPKFMQKKFNARLPKIQKKAIDLFDENVKNKIQKVKQIQAEQLYKFPTMQIQSYNIQLSDTNFGESIQFAVQIQMLASKNKFDRHDHHEVFPIQVASYLDQTTISEVVNYKQLDQKLISAISYQVITFKNNPQLQRNKQYITYSDQLTERQIKTREENIKERENQLNLAVELSKSPKDIKLKQIQYEHFHKKYQIGNMQSESPICIFSAGYKIFSKDKYKPFFQTIERQNYTNFHIVYIDDNSPDDSAYKIFEYLNSTNTRLNNRISILHNLQHMGALANMFFWIRKYCSEESIVMIVDGDDSIIGYQVFQVLNAIYKNQSNWYVYSNYVAYVPQNGLYTDGISEDFNAKSQDYRIIQQMWSTSHLRTFRKKLMDAVPIQHFIQYHYNSTNQLAIPRFYQSAVDRFQAYSQIELAGDDRLLHITDYLYLYEEVIDVNSNKCYHQHQKINQFKSRVKTPLKRLQGWGEKVQYIEKYIIPNKIMDLLASKYHQYKLCIKIQN